MAPPIVILTGAGISRESGLATFRDADGIWARHRIEDVATPQAFARNPDLVQGFYNEAHTLEFSLILIYSHFKQEYLYMVRLA